MAAYFSFGIAMNAPAGPFRDVYKPGRIQGQWLPGDYSGIPLLSRPARWLRGFPGSKQKIRPPLPD